MNYIGLLTKEEKSTLCEIITGKEFKELFKRNEQEFSKIQKGFRAKSLTEQHALSIAITNISCRFEELKLYQFCPAHLPSTHGKRVLSGEDTLCQLQMIDLIPRKRQRV